MRSTINKKLVTLLVIMFVILTVFTIKVNAEDTQFAMREESVDISLNETKTIYTVGGDSDTDIVWTSSNENVVTVDEKGKATGVSVGTATITAKMGAETATCTVNVGYTSMAIKANGTDVAQSIGVNLILNVHDSEKLQLVAKDYNLEEVANVEVEWKSSDSTVVSVTADGTIKGVKAGTATITASTDGGDVSCEVNVYSSNTTDFSNAKFEANISFTTYTTENIKVSGITMNDQSNYYYIISSSNSEPEIIIGERGEIDKTAMEGTIEEFKRDTEENYLITEDVSAYAELNQDMYLWIIQEERLQKNYNDEDGNSISYNTKVVVEGKKIEKAELPKLNSIIRLLDINRRSTQITFMFPSAQENRKFNIRIGRITDSAILSKIQQNDYTGITDLLDYAKENNALCSETLTTTGVGRYESDSALLDGARLNNGEYYYIYIKFDDENGKYEPVEAVTLTQAVNSSNIWFLCTLSDDRFTWNNLGSGEEQEPEEQEPEQKPTQEPEEKPETPEQKPQNDPTTAPGTIPQTGEITLIVVASVVAIVAVGVVFYKKYNYLKGIK